MLYAMDALELVIQTAQHVMPLQSQLMEYLISVLLNAQIMHLISMHSPIHYANNVIASVHHALVKMIITVSHVHHQKKKILQAYRKILSTVKILALLGCSNQMTFVIVI